ncbi:MAG: ABC-F family ATP-binding cassette domain-containing protein [Deltaproteobacteria bacterium]|nr:ABC-F family ATP-binding cassette domain-containing protein [Deltaproteobacteria bacterium]
MSLVHARDLSIRFGPKIILEGASFTIGTHDRIGLIGPNGSGKSTLMKILAGAQEPDGGDVQRVRRARAGYLAQEIGQLPEGSLIEGVLASVPGRTELEKRLAEAEAAMSKAAQKSEEEQLELAEELAELHEELAHHEERFGRHRAEEILQGLGFRTEQFAQPARSLSGGWRMRAALGSLLLQDPDLLLLDEPTNHLDVPTLEWFDGFMKRQAKALVLVSHDREFLDRQIDRVVSLEPEGLRTYKGNYEAYLVQRADELEVLRNRVEKQEAKREQLQQFITRFKAKASKARQAQSKQKLLDKMERIELPEERSTVSFRFPPASRSGREVLTLKHVSKSYGSNSVYRNLDAQLLRGERIAVIGLNGAGKTTLLKLVAGEAEADAGEVTLGHNVELGYYAQHHTEKLVTSRTILEEVHELVPTEPQSWVRSILGSFLFSGDDVDKKIGVLSGGEKARVALAKLLVVPSNFLLMDEPTNHLDLDSSEALIDALRDYDGTLLFVSHNRSFVNGLATQVWEVKDGRIDAQPGNLDDWHERQAVEREREKAQAQAQQGLGKDEAAAGGQGKEARRERAAEREKRNKALGPLKKEIAAIEAKIAETEKAKKSAEEQLADPALFADSAKSTPIVNAFRAATHTLEDLYAEWEAKSEKLAAAEASLDLA